MLRWRRGKEVRLGFAANIGTVLERFDCLRIVSARNVSNAGLKSSDSLSRT